jgi:hypothetical protein
MSNAPQNELADQLAQRVGITPEQANTAITIVSRTLLQKAEPNKASSLLSSYHPVLPACSQTMTNSNSQAHSRMSAMRKWCNE